MFLFKRLWLLGFLLVFTAGCASINPNFEQPRVTLSSFRLLPANNSVPRFEIGLHLINPNRSPLKLLGMSYEVELEGHRVLSGVANELPLIPAYGEGDLLLQATPDLFSGIGLFTDLMNRPREKFNFNFSAWLDVGKLLPKIRVEKSGEITLPSRTTGQ